MKIPAAKPQKRQEEDKEHEAAGLAFLTGRVAELKASANKGNANPDRREDEQKAKVFAEEVQTTLPDGAGLSTRLHQHRVAINKFAATAAVIAKARGYSLNFMTTFSKASKTGVKNLRSGVNKELQYVRN